MSRTNPKKIARGSRTALVTGAGGGIGSSFARQLAQLGYNLLLTNRNPAPLQPLARELRQDFGVEVRTLELDLAAAGAAEELFDWSRREGMEVDVLINNAGTFSFLDVLRTPTERLDRILLLHDRTTIIACRLFAERMVERGTDGYILNMASYSQWMPYPGLAIYSASKACLKSFSVAFAREVRERGIRVTAVCPAGVATDLYGLPAKLQRVGVRTGILLSADSCARRALRALWRGKRCCVPGWWNRLGIPFCMFTPGLLVRIARKYTMKLQR